MKKLLILTLCMMAVLTGCGGSTDTPTEILPEESSPVAEIEETESTPEELLHVTVETVKISVDELKAQEYIVPVHVIISKNPGITYSEWGLNVDTKCTFTATSDGLPFNTVYAINDEEHFLWTAWTSGSENAEIGELLEVDVKLPMDATSGSTYSISYADMSFAEKPHVWSNSVSDYVAAGQVGWTDGSIMVTE